MKAFATSPPTSQALRFTPLWLVCLLILSVLSAARAANTFVTTGSLITARQAHTATLLHNGKVLVAGGHASFNPVAIAELYDPASGVWTNTGTLATGRYAHTATLLPNGKVLVAGGYNNSGNAIGSAELYDPASGTWSATGSLASGRAFHTAVLLGNGKVLVCGGTNGGGPFGSAELYDPATGAWSATGTMAVARQAHTATLLPNGKVLVVGGTDGFGTFFGSAELYDPSTSNWTGTGTLTGTRAYHTACLSPNGKVLVAGGQTTGFSGLATAQLYDPATSTWTGTGSLTTARYAHSATLLPNGNVLVAGGQTTGGGFLASAQFYDWTTGAWNTFPINLATARAYHTATLLPNGRALVAGGVTTGNNAVATAELFEPAVGAWRPTGYLTTPRMNHTATLLGNGKALVAGGFYFDENGAPHYPLGAEIHDPATGNWNGTGALSAGRQYHTATLLPNGKVLVAGGDANGVGSAELYDPVTGLWSATGAPTARGRHTATLLPNGKVLIAGGTNSGGFLASAELYDPATGAWTATGNLGTQRYLHTATLLPNGKVLVVGGASSNSSADILASAELYDPATGSWNPTGALAAAREYHTATLLPAGKVIVVAGYGGGFVGSSELYDPASGTWSSTGSTTQRVRHTTTLLPNGKVLAVGGVQGPNGGVPNAELYDPATGIWTATGYPREERESHTATLLPNGKVLIAGGFWYFDFDTFTEYDHDSAELYDVGLGFSSAWQPQITSASFDVSGRLVLKGAGFRGVSSASGGNGAQDSPTSFPVVQWRRLDNEQSSFLLSDSATPVSATRFTSVPTSSLTPGHALVRVFANGIPSAAFPVLIGFPSIAVELPNGTVIPDGGTLSFPSVLGTPVTLTFTVRNVGSVNLTGLAVTKDGPNAADFTLTASPTSPVLPSGSTTFTIQFASASTGTKTATFHISNNVAGFQPYDINLVANPLALSFTQDTDGDGLNDAAEVQLASLGFDWQLNQSALVNSLFPNLNGALSNLNAAGYFTTAQVQALNVGVPLLQRNPATGVFKLTIGVKKTTNLLLPFTDFPMNAPGTDTFINAQGKLEFEFTVPDNAAFFRLEAQ